MSGLLHSQRVFKALIALACGAAFFVIGYRVLGSGHPAEDAYILFRYADHLAEGHGIVFNIGGPHTEGATDFLWLLLLASGVRAGGDVAVVALVLNAAGAALAGWLLAGLCWGDRHRPYWVRGLLLLVIPATFLAGGAVAGYWGFSSMLYSALILLLLALTVEARGHALALIPIVGLVVALFRPDGLIVGASAAALGLWRARTDNVLKRYLLVAAGCAVVAGGYMAWRWQYFGLPLPLPLYVKQNGPSGSGWSALFPGLRSNWDWFFDRTGPHFILLALIAVLLYRRFWRELSLIRLLIFMTPVFLLLAALALAAQTQNLEFRFQSPAHLVLLYGLLFAAAQAFDSRRMPGTQWVVLAVVLAATTPSNMAGVRAIGLQLNGTWRNYVEPFAARFGPSMKANTRVVLTEAGAVPYWTTANVIDIVGLNYAPAALRPPTVRDVKEIEPDVVFLHQAGSLVNDVLIPPAEEGGRIHVVQPERLRAALSPSRREILDRHVTRYADAGLLNLQYGATVLLEFLAESSNYDILVVDPTGRKSYVHVWGFKKDWPLREEARGALTWSFEHYTPYLEVRQRQQEQRLATGASF